MEVQKDKLIFDRKIKQGSGSSIYGLEVCKSLDLEPTFIELASNIRNIILDRQIIGYKKSKYNAQIFIDKCGICNEKSSEIHHISHQKDADENGFIQHFHKNKKFNLLNVCEKCHNDIHQGKININNRVLTSEGIQII